MTSNSMMGRIGRVLAAGVVALTVITPPATAAVAAIVAPAFDWTMPDRFGGDLDEDGRIDLPNTPEYVAGRHPGSCPAGPCEPAPFLVHLDASATTATMGDRALDILGFQWRLASATVTQPLEYWSASPRLTVALHEATYQAQLTVVAALPEGGTVTARVTRPLVVEDLLVVALGDSYAAGEGNPETRRDGDTPAVWADGATPAAEAAHHAAHRSSVAWPVHTAMRLEASDRHTSVTFVSVATSGATIDRGVLGPQQPRSAIAQLDQASALIGDRQVDLVLLSIGGNDIGFGRMIHGLVDADRLADPLCYAVDLDNVWASVADGDWNRTSRVHVDILGGRIGCRTEWSGTGTLLPGLDGLSGAFARLAAALSDRLDPAAVLITEYPDPTGGENDACGEIVGDTTPPFRFHEIDATEAALGRDRVLAPLNATITAAARSAGWVVVRHLDRAFGAGHGYCGEWPDYGYPESFTSRPSWMTSRLDHPDAWYAVPGPEGIDPRIGGPGVTWYRTAAQSAVLQGPDNRTSTSGTLHPNEFGHQAIAVAASAALRVRNLP